MKKIAVSAALVVVFTLSSALAGACSGGGCGGGGKGKDDKKKDDSTSSTAFVRIAL
ncbi:MAG: hypothetical protein IAE94_01540 [Chthoniobacterales bacterium]|nr:hypothetical protein [Chthoniobacterales bacterium]